MNMMDMFRRVCLIDIVRLACLSLSLEMMESDLRSTSRSISIGIYIYIYVCFTAVLANLGPGSMEQRPPKLSTSNLTTLFNVIG